MQTCGKKSKAGKHRRLGIFFVAALMLVGARAQSFSGETEGIPTLVQSGAERRTVWDGVYTEAQSASGETVYEQHCAVCHGEAASGQRGPQLVGEEFFEDWREDSLGALYGFIRTNMPRRRPPLEDSDYLAVTTYILRENGFPSGNEGLTVRSMGAVRIEGKDGPKPLPPNSLVQVTGCLTPDGGDWDLTMASEPVRNRNADPEREATEEELKAAMEAPTGDWTFDLTNFFMLGDFDPAAHEGHKMLARGALLRRPSGDRISLFGLDMVAVACGQ